MRTGPVEVYERLTATPPDGLSSEELESLADAAFWLGRLRESISARQRAYAKYRDAGDAERATRTACRLFHNHFDMDETVAAGGWLKRAHRHACDVPEGVEHGYLAMADADWALYNGKLDEAVGCAGRASELGQRFGDRDIETLGLATQGRVLVARGDVAEGLDRLDEAMVAVLSDELTPFITGWVYCVLLDTCQRLGDVRRATEWTDLAVRWCEAHGQDSWYPGLCRLHRCEIQSLRGDWAAAEREALRAAEELGPFGTYLAAAGEYLAGEIRRRMGDSDAAEEAFRRAHAYGLDPQPGLALLRMAQGDSAGAAAALRSALAGASGGPLSRGRLLAAYAEAELRLGNVDAAVRAADELTGLAEANRALLLRAIAAVTQATVLMARDDVRDALPLLRDARAIYGELSCPYETAQTRVLLGVAARRLGDEETARLELEAARTTFERLGAPPEVERVTALLANAEPALLGLTAREVEVLRLAAHGSSNREIGSTLFISEHTVARHLSNIFRKIGVTSRAAATSFAYEHGLA